MINELVVSYPPGASMPTDTEIEDNIRAKLLENPDLNLLDIQVTVNAGQVTLKGTVDAYWKKLHAEDLVADEPGVSLIDNHLGVVPVSRSKGQACGRYSALRDIAGCETDNYICSRCCIKN